MCNNIMIIKDLQCIVAATNGTNALLCGDKAGKCAVSFGVVTDLMLNLMSVEI